MFLHRPKPHGNACQDTLQAYPCGLYAGHPWPSKVLSGITARLRPYFRFGWDTLGTKLRCIAQLKWFAGLVGGSVENAEANY